jgi:hypothetical protein
LFYGIIIHGIHFNYIHMVRSGIDR